jgi:hypothetical protein
MLFYLKLASFGSCFDAGRKIAASCSLSTYLALCSAIVFSVSASTSVIGIMRDNEAGASVYLRLLCDACGGRMRVGAILASAKQNLKGGSH